MDTFRKNKIIYYFHLFVSHSERSNIPCLLVAIIDSRDSKQTTDWGLMGINMNYYRGMCLSLDQLPIQAPKLFKHQLVTNLRKLNTFRIEIAFTISYPLYDDGYVMDICSKNGYFIMNKDIHSSMGDGRSNVSLLN